MLSDASSRARTTSLPLQFLLPADQLSLLPQSIQGLVAACASDHFLFDTGSWRNTPVLVPPHYTTLDAGIRRCPRYEQQLRLTALMLNNEPSTYYGAGDDQ